MIPSTFRRVVTIAFTTISVAHGQTAAVSNSVESINSSPPNAYLAAQASKLTTTEEAVVNCVWFRGGGDVPAEGGTSPVTIRVSPNPNGSTPVAIAEDFMNSAGDMWRSSAWIAAFCASRLNDCLIHEHEFLVKAGGYIDGPSAGMLIATTMTALLRGDPILPDSTMTGTINPDGSAGPVGGIVEKLTGAKESGIKRFGFPVGCRITINANTKEPEDLISKGRDELGIEVVEIGDIYDAYRFLTGKELPRNEPASESKMQIPIGLAHRVRGASLAMRSESQQRMDELKRTFSTLKSGSREAQESELQPIKAYIIRSEMAERDGNLALAFSHAQKADAQSRLAKLMYEMGTHVKRGDIGSYRKVGIDQGEATLSSMDSLRMSLRAGVDRTTVGGKVDALHSYMIYWQGRAMLQSGLATYRELANTGKQMDAVLQKSAASKSQTADTAELDKVLKNYVQLAEEATARFAFAQCRAEAASKWSSFAQEGGREVRVNPELYAKLGKAYSMAAAAGLGWYESMFIADEADRMGASAKALTAYLQVYNAEFSPIHYAAHFAGASAAGGGKAKETLAPLDQLASGVFAYHGVARMINKKYNFRAISGTEDAPDMELTKRKSLGHALDLARRRVLEEATRVEKVAGFIPDSVKLNYDLGNVLRDGNDNDKLNALTTYWTCSLLCDLTRALASSNN